MLKGFLSEFELFRTRTPESGKENMTTSRNGPFERDRKLRVGLPLTKKWKQTRSSVDVVRRENRLWPLFGELLADEDLFQ